MTEPTVATAPAPPPDDGGGAQEAPRRTSIIAKIPESAALVVVLAGLMIFFSVKSEFFFQQDNIVNILSAAAVLGVVSCPLTMLLISGQFDLSVGSGVALGSVVFGYGVSQGDSVTVMVLLTLGVGVAIGAANGFFVTTVGLNSIIVTLGMFELLRGLAQLRTDGTGIGFEGFETLALDRPLFDAPWSVFIFLGVVVLSALTMRFTTFGRSLYAIGANPLAARLSGIRVQRVIFIAFVISGIAIALGALMVASQTGQASGNAAIGLELQAVTAVILGGASLAGGRGTILGTLLGVLILGVIDNGLTLLSVSSFWQQVTRGGLLIAAVTIDQVRLRLTKA